MRVVAQARPDVIVHQMTAISVKRAGKADMKHMDRWFAGINRLRTEGTDHLLVAAEATDVPHFVAQAHGAWNGLRYRPGPRAAGPRRVHHDEPAPANERLFHLAACAGAKRPMWVPAWLARPLAGDVAVLMMAEGRGFSNAKAKAELGWQLRHPSWRQGFKEELA
ncbi:hypothetical protein [Nonomuraea sp. NPDC049400]|uniref:hypothetical protein n=1 Tax=Nonomuraea sp. NPDC049400 TaxID=3364352 RepID=UPI00379A462C